MPKLEGVTVLVSGSHDALCFDHMMYFTLLAVSVTHTLYSTVIILCISTWKVPGPSVQWHFSIVNYSVVRIVCDILTNIKRLELKVITCLLSDKQFILL